MINLYENNIGQFAHTEKANKGRVKNKITSRVNPDYSPLKSMTYTKDLERQAKLLKKAQEKVNSSFKRNIAILSKSRK